MSSMRTAKLFLQQNVEHRRRSKRTGHVYLRLRAAPIFSQSVEREAKKKKERAKIGDEANGSEARKNEANFISK